VLPVQYGRNEMTVPIYHITNIRNLHSILARNELLCDNQGKLHGLDIVEIAYEDLKERRACTPVPVGNDGCLADYVPFYFAPRSPMLFAIHKGCVVGYDEGQTKILHLVSSVEEVVRRSRPFVFTDGHPVMMISQFYTNVDDLKEIDWAIMRARYWADTIEDGDRRRRRQAEFLVHQAFPWDAVREIGVKNEKVKGEVLANLEGADYQPSVVVKPDWYY